MECKFDYCVSHAGWFFRYSVGIIFSLLFIFLVIVASIVSLPSKIIAQNYREVFYAFLSNLFVVFWTWYFTWPMIKQTFFVGFFINTPDDFLEVYNLHKMLLRKVKMADIVKAYSNKSMKYGGRALREVLVFETKDGVKIPISSNVENLQNLFYYVKGKANIEYEDIEVLKDDPLVWDNGKKNLIW